MRYPIPLIFSYTEPHKAQRAPPILPPGPSQVRNSTSEIESTQPQPIASTSTTTTTTTTAVPHSAHPASNTSHSQENLNLTSSNPNINDSTGSIARKPASNVARFSYLALTGNNDPNNQNAIPSPLPLRKSSTTLHHELHTPTAVSTPPPQIVPRVSSSSEQLKHVLTKSQESLRQVPSSSSISADAQAQQHQQQQPQVEVAACGTCGCQDFTANVFKGGNMCNNCFHAH